MDGSEVAKHFIDPNTFYSHQFFPPRYKICGDDKKHARCKICSFQPQINFYRWLRQHPRILELPWKANVKRSEKSNVIDQLVSGIHEFAQLNNENYWNTYFTENVLPFSLVGLIT